MGCDFLTEKQDLDVYIKNLLKQGPLSYDEIKNRVINDSEHVKAPSRNMSYNEVFNKFLKLGIIEIVGYDLPEDWNPEENNAKRIQSMNVTNLIFNLVKTNSFQIFNLINELGADNNHKAYNELKNLFKKKIKEIDEENKNKWNSLVSSVKVRDPRDEDLLLLEGETEVDAFLIAHHVYMNDFEIETVYGISNKVDKYKEIFPEIKQKYSDTKIYYLKNSVNEIDIQPLIGRILNTPVVEDDLGIEHYLKEDKQYDDMNYEKEISADGSIDMGAYLESFGFVKPEIRSVQELDTLFDDVLYYLNSQEAKQAAMQMFSRALSDHKKSTELLNDIILEAAG